MMEDLLKDNAEHGYEDYTENFDREKKSCCKQDGEGGGCCKKDGNEVIIIKN